MTIASINDRGEIIWSNMDKNLRPVLRRERLGHYNKYMNQYVSWPITVENVERIRRFAEWINVEIRSDILHDLDIAKPEELVDYFLTVRYLMSSTDHSHLKWRAGIRIRPSTHIQAGMEYALHTPRCFISDPDENDRRAIALLAIDQAQSYPCIVVHHGPEAGTWRKMITEYLTVPPAVLDISQVNSQTHKRSIWLANYHDLEKRGFSLPAGMTHWSVIVDHGHLFRNPMTNRAEHLTKLCRHVNYCFLLTEFQINRSERDLWGLLRTLDRQEEFLEFRDHLTGYLDQQLNSPTPSFLKQATEPKLRALYFSLRSLCLLRRAEDPELGVQEQIRSIPLGPLPMDFQGTYIPSPRRWLGLKKVQGATEWLKAQLAREGGAMLILAHHNDVSEAIAKQLGCQVIYGRNRSPEKRNRALQEFMKPQGPRTLVVAKDVTLPWADLSFVQKIVFIEPPQTPLEAEEILGPIVSAQSEPHLMVYYLLAEHRLDRAALRRLDLRKRLSRSILDGEKP